MYLKKKNASTQIVICWMNTEVQNKNPNTSMPIPSLKFIFDERSVFLCANVNQHNKSGLQLTLKKYIGGTKQRNYRRTLHFRIKPKKNLIYWWMKKSWCSSSLDGSYSTTVKKKVINKCRTQQKDKYEQARGTYLHNPRSLLLSRAVLARFTLTGLSWLTAGRAGELSSVFLFLLASFAPFFGVLLALAGSSSDTSPLPACFPFFFASPPFLPPPPLDATCLLGGFLLLGDGPLACTE